LPDNPERRRLHQRMNVIYIRLDQELEQQLRRVADAEKETVSTIARRFLRRGMRSATEVDRSLARAHEGTGRDR
jgi:predicted transcriptional regulator